MKIPLFAYVKYNMKKRYAEIIIVSLAMVVLIGWFFKDALFSGKIFVERDLGRYYYPLRFFAANCVKSGIFPLWNPYLFCGNPLFASLQSCVLYPLSVIYYLGDFAKMFNVFIVAHFFLAGIFTYIFLRQMRYSVFASFLSGVGFALSGYMVSVVNLLTTLSSVTWFPLAVLFYYRMIRKISNHNVILRETERRPKDLKERFFASLRMTCFWDAVMLGIIFTIMFLGGEPSVLYMTVGLFCLGAAYFTIEGFVERRGVLQYAPTCYIKGMFLAIIVFFVLSAFQILPFIEFLKISSRDKTSYEMASVWNFPLNDFPAIVWPFFHDAYKLFTNYWARQSWLDNYYIGILIFVLFLVAVLFDKTKKSRALFILGLIGFAVSLGKDTILFGFMHNFVPGFKIIRYSVRFFFIPTFAICVLAGIGLDYYMNHIKTDERLRRMAKFMLVLAFLFSVAFFILNFNYESCVNFVRLKAEKIALSSNMPVIYVQNAIKAPIFLKFIESDMMNLKRAFLLLLFFGFMFFMGSKENLRTKIFIVPFLAFLAISDIFQVNGGYNPLCNAKKFTSPSSNIEYLTKEQKGKPLFRIICSPQTVREHSYVPEADFHKALEACKDRLITNRTAEFGIYDVNMYGSMYNKRNSKFLRLIMEKKTNNLEKFLALLNIRFIASSSVPKLNVGANGRSPMLANKTDAANLYELEKYLPRAFLVNNAVVIKDEEKILDYLRDDNFQPDREIVLEEYISIPLCVMSDASSEGDFWNAETVKIINYTPNKIEIEVKVANEPKFLVLSDTYYPGWQALVDAKKQEVLRADYILRAVYLNPGEHKVKFIYNPFSFRLGIFITCAGLIILTLIVLYNIIILRKTHRA